MTSNPYPVPQSSRHLTIYAWLTTILISVLPDIVWIELLHADPSRLTMVKMGLLLVLAWRPSFGNRCARCAISSLCCWSSSAWLNCARASTSPGPACRPCSANSVFDARMQAEQTGKLAVSVGMIAHLFVLGYKRRDFFLTRGDLRAPIQPVPLLGFPKPDTLAGLACSGLFTSPLPWPSCSTLACGRAATGMLKVVPVLPSILFYAALNAFNEEITYRAPMLATLEPVGGSRQALWMAAYFFGIAHYFGTPGGILGGIASIFMGWILGKGMLETRGLFWTWWIHFLSDVAIFTFLAAALLK